MRELGSTYKIPIRRQSYQRVSEVGRSTGVFHQQDISCKAKAM